MTGRPRTTRWKWIALTLVVEAVLAVGLIWLIRPRSATPVVHTFAAVRDESGLLLSTPAVTATSGHHNSAVLLTIVNNTSEAITVTSLSSPLSTRGMLHVDPNMCDPASVMTQIPSLRLPARRGVHLGLRGAGAMLLSLRAPVVVGERVPLTVTWWDARGVVHVTSITAPVIPAPAHLQYTTMTM